MTIPVMLVGNPVDKDLNLSYEIINDEKYTTASAEHYEVLEAKVPKGEQRGYIKVRVSNPNLLNLGTPTLTLRLKLVDNNDVQAGGWLDYLTIDLTWSSDVVKPTTWNSMRWFTCIQYSSNVYQYKIAMMVGGFEYSYNKELKIALIVGISMFVGLFNVERFGWLWGELKWFGMVGGIRVWLGIW